MALKRKLITLFLSFSLIFFTLSLGLSLATEEAKWQGLDEAVIGKIASEHGREPKESFLALEGDLELFMFSLLSGLSGIVVGYYLRKFLVEHTHASFSGK